MKLKELPDNPSEEEIALYLGDGIKEERSAVREQLRASEGYSEGASKGILQQLQQLNLIS